MLAAATIGRVSAGGVSWGGGGVGAGAGVASGAGCGVGVGGGVDAQAASTAAKQPASFWKERMEPPRREWRPPIVFLGHCFAPGAAERKGLVAAAKRRLATPLFAVC